MSLRASERFHQHPIIKWNFRTRNRRQTINKLISFATHKVFNFTDSIHTYRLQFLPSMNRMVAYTFMVSVFYFDFRSGVRLSNCMIIWADDAYIWMARAHRMKDFHSKLQESILSSCIISAEIKKHQKYFQMRRLMEKKKIYRISFNISIWYGIRFKCDLACVQINYHSQYSQKEYS